MKQEKSICENKPKSLTELFDYQTKSSHFNVGDLIDLLDGKGPCMIIEVVLDKDVEEWKYKVLFPKNNMEIFLWEKKLRYYSDTNQIKVFKKG